MSKGMLVEVLYSKPVLDKFRKSVQRAIREATDEAARQTALGHQCTSVVWIPTAKQNPPKPGNYFVTYYAPLSGRNDTVDLFWSGVEWQPIIRKAKGHKAEEIVLNIIAWCEHPEPYQEG